MRPEVPDNADVGLMEAEIDAARRHEVDVAKLTRIDELLDRAHRRAIEEGVTGHKYEARVGGHRDEVANLGGRAGERLLDEHVLAGGEGGPGERVMGADRGRDDDRIDALVSEHLVGRARAPRVRVAAADRREGLRAHVAQRAKLVFREIRDVSREVRPPVAEADHADPYAVAIAHQPVPLCRSMSSGVRTSRRKSRPSDQPRA